MNTPPKSKLKIDFFWIKIGGLILGSLFCLFGIFKVTESFQKDAEEIKKLRAENVAKQVGNQTEILEGELDRFSEDIAKLESYFPDQGKILDFIVALDALEKSGVITSFEIVSDRAVNDNLGLPGIPLSVTIVGGDGSRINQAMESLSALPNLIRPIILNIKRGEDGNLETELGGFTYVDEKFSETR